MKGQSQRDDPPALLQSVRTLGATALAMLHTRLALAGVELEEELQRLVILLVLALAALLFLALGMVVVTFLIVLIVAEPNRVTALAVLGILYIGASLVLGLRVKTLLALRPTLLAATLAELAKDQAALRPAPAASPPGAAGSSAPGSAAADGSGGSASQATARRRGEG